MLRSGGLLILRRYADRLAGQRLVAVHVGDCEPVLLKRFFKKWGGARNPDLLSR